MEGMERKPFTIERRGRHPVMSSRWSWGETPAKLAGWNSRVGESAMPGAAVFRFKCTSCDQWHEGMPGFGAEAPLYYYSIPAEARGSRCVLESDTCIVDGEHFFPR